MSACIVGLIALNCALPPVSFVEAYEVACMSKWPGVRGESIDAVQRRIFDGQAAYSEYRANYRDACHPPGPEAGSINCTLDPRMCTQGQRP